ncbi:MAG: AI-2E family transporter [Oceanospirillaceae bacterium]|jgi:predicted PurR-regulated permease PerM|nr:AI-2E family transporter [Oceanospirillaceae bacterium]MBT4441711.1 AI-2E family transporter [Oceanospirillaceae bacterium]MBT6077253.1 AI-2E family transporter [Oceanospirillaceae bacterium]MBT7329637.1 AI-2E family transporter [Oceanospirillaceae bacterium]
MTQSQTWLLIVVSLIVAMLLYSLQAVLTPFLVGIGIAYMADPFADRLEARGWSRTLAACVVFLVLTLVVVAMLIGLVPLVMKQIQTLIYMLPQVETWYNLVLLPWLQDTLAIDIKSLKLDIVTEGLAAEWKQAGGIISRVVKYATSSTMSLISTFGSMAMVPVVAFYLLRDFDLLTAKVNALLPRNIQPKVSAWASESDEVLAAFVRGQLLVMFCLGIIYAMGLSFVSLNYALLIGILAGLASIVPYLGFAVGLAAAMTIALFQFDGYWPLLMVFAVFGVGQLIESFILTPLLVGDRIGLHPVAVIFAILAGGQLFGFLGVLLALPVAAVIMVLLRHLHAGYINSPLYGQQDPE